MHFGDAATLPLRYLAWHYSRGLSEAVVLWGRSFRFATEFTAARLHLRTFFAPFQRIEDHGRHDLEDKIASLVANGLMRVVGVVARTCTLALTLGIYAALAVLGVSALVGWVFLPGILAATFSLGLYALLR